MIKIKISIEILKLSGNYRGHAGGIFCPSG
jgi:hypothetical protein